MCGYCTESAVLAQLLDEMKHGPVSHDPFLYAIYLQQAVDWRAELASWECCDHPRGALVALCRQWSERIADRSPSPLVDMLDADAFVALQDWLASLGYSPQWRQAQGIDGAPPDLPSIAQAQGQLDAYIAGWLKPMGANAWDQKTLHDRFLEVSIALDVVTKCAPADERLQTLAIVSPDQTPYFDALDLWLQRRALQASVVSHGVEFISEHQAEIRFEAILAMVVGDLLAKGDLLRLEAALQAPSPAPFDFWVDPLLGVVQAKLLCLATDLSQS
jgi:hypothetical protein